MKGTVLLCVFAALVLLGQLVAAVPTQLNYKKGQEFVFRLDASVDARDANGDTLNPHSGSFSTMNGTVVVQCTDLNAEAYLFVMNMFDVYVGVGQSAGTQAQDSEPTPVAVGSQPLGKNMYFKQMKTGEIVTIWYDTSDSPYFVQVKVGAINAFQTRIVAPGNSQKFVESDPVGKHTTQFSSAGSSSLRVSKIFNQNDVTSWATDQHLSSKNVMLEYAHVANVDASGFIAGASLQQTVLLTNTPTSAASRDMRVGLAFPQATSDDGFNMLMRSHGDMAVTLRSHSIVDRTTTRLTSAPLFDFAGVSSSLLKEDTMFDFAAKAGAAASAVAAPPIEPEATVKAIIKGDEEDAKDSPRTFALMNQLIQYLNVFPERVASLLRAYLADAQAPRTRLFYVLASLNRNVESESLLVQYGLSSDNHEVVLSAIFAAGSIQAPTGFIAHALRTLFSTSLDAEISSSALLAFSSVVGRLHEDDADTEKLRRDTAEILLSRMYGRATGDAQSIALAVRAIANAGPAVVELKKIPFAQVLNTLRSTNEVGVRVIKVALKHLIERYAATVSVSDELVAQFGSVMVASNDDFPFNKSYTKDILIGGKKLSLDVEGKLFVGTNFDCKHDYFNYEGLAQVTGDLTLFDSLVQAFDAHAIYGKVNGSPLANELLLVVLGKTLYQKAIPSVNLDCSLHSYNLYHAQPAISAKYVVWVSVIPIVFQASAGLTVNVDWGWQVCDSDLSAMVQIVPAAGAQVSGSVLIDLLVIKAGIQLAGTVNSALQPQAYIHGTKCAVGFDVHWKASAMSAYFQSFYQVKKCKFLIWDCKWMPEQVQTWWQWSHPAKDEIIYQKEWQIVRA